MPVERTEKKTFNFRGPAPVDQQMLKRAACDQLKHQLASVLAQIDLASCFRNEEEPLFSILSPIIYEHLTQPREGPAFLIPAEVRAISFGRVIWMLEKAGIPPSLATKKREAVETCAYNIARWWIVEHHQRKKEDVDISFPGEVAMPQGMVPSALWLAMQEYDGVWDRGRYPGDYDRFEAMGFLGDLKGQAVFDALQIYGVGTSLGPVWRPTWYRSNFVEWAQSILDLSEIPDVRKHNPKLLYGWCGMMKAVYPYVKVKDVPGPGADNPWRAVRARREDRSPMAYDEEFFAPKWGAHLRKAICEGEGKSDEEGKSDSEETEGTE